MTLFSASGQIYILLWAISFGCASGIIYEIGTFFRRLFKFKLFINIICDVIFCAIVILSFILYFTYVCDFKLRIYIFLGISLGFFCERISIGNYIAKICNIVYNKCTKLKNKLITKHNAKKALKKKQS